MRPELTKDISAKTFREYYWLKEELTTFCRKVGIISTGGKQDIQHRIEHYLKTGEKLDKKVDFSNKQKLKKQDIPSDAIISENYKNDAQHRAFFKSVVGERFKFNVIFMKWMKSNIGKTYQDAVDEWLRIEAEKKSGKKYTIGSQFEYNQYTRDFFKNNPERKRNDAIKCWKFKKSQPGANKYELSDSKVLKKNLI